MIVRRIVTGVLVGAAWFLALCYMPGWMLFGVLLVMSCVCQNEFYQMMRLGGYPLSRNYGLTMGALWLTVCYAFPPYAQARVADAGIGELLGVGRAGLLLQLRLLFDSRSRGPSTCGDHAAGFFYLPFMRGFFIRLAQGGAVGMFEIPSARGGVYLASFLAVVVKLSDVGGFAVGLLAGRHKMFPRISPKKSWEGLAGGIAASMAGSVGMIKLAQNCPWLSGGPFQELGTVHALVIGLVLALVGVLGDLVESMFKRAVNTKDSAGLLPGMGGLLDMFDSLTFTPAVLYFYLAWFVGQAVSP
jgi:phosphatidate cytidylyltransferase